MKYRKFNKYEKKEVRAETMRTVQQGAGLYLFENRLNGDLTLPRPTKSGVRIVGPKQQFQGDNYYMQMVRTGELRLIKELVSPERQQEQLMEEQKLILDQPERVTNKGQTEHVVDNSTPRQKLNERNDEDQPDVLLNESPADDGFIIVTG
jgi:hypothetical protein